MQAPFLVILALSLVASGFFPHSAAADTRPSGFTPVEGSDDQIEGAIGVGTQFFEQTLRVGRHFQDRPTESALGFHRTDREEDLTDRAASTNTDYLWRAQYAYYRVQGTGQSAAGTSISDEGHFFDLGFGWDVSRRMRFDLDATYLTLPAETYHMGGAFLRWQYLLLPISKSKREDIKDLPDAVAYYRQFKLVPEAERDDTGSFPKLRLAVDLQYNQHQNEAISGLAAALGKSLTTVVNETVVAPALVFSPSDALDLRVQGWFHSYDQAPGVLAAPTRILTLGMVRAVPSENALGSAPGQLLAFPSFVMDESAYWRFSELDALELNANQSTYETSTQPSSIGFGAYYFRLLGKKDHWRAGLGADMVTSSAQSETFGTASISYLF